MQKQRQAVELYSAGFSQSEIAQILGIHQSTVSRYFNKPSSHEIEDFYENHAYGAFIVKDGTAILFNRRYKPLADKNLWVKDIVKTVWFYNDGTRWQDRFTNSIKQIPVYTQVKV